MRHLQSAWWRLLLVAGSCVFLLAGVLTAAARAETATGYGELTRFAGATGEGALSAERTRALGVNPTDNSVYVLDEPEPEEQIERENAKEETEFEVVRHFRLQKFSATGALLASASFTETAPGETSEERASEGIAVDTKLKRVYLLAVDLREASPQFPDSGSPVASTLYAFSTEASGSKLVGAGKEGADKEILAGPKKLEAQSKTAGKALLEPAGITVDPANDDVIILAHEDHQGAEHDSLPNAEDHYVLQAVTSAGALSTRYVDSTNFLKHDASASELSAKPDSPIVVGPESSEHIVLNYDGLVEISSNLALKEPPKTLFEEPHGQEVESGASLEHGGALSVSREGVIFGMAHIENEVGVTSEVEPGVFLRSGSSGAEIGWTGGQSPAVSLESKEEDRCVLGTAGEESTALVAAGSGGKVFVLAPEFLSQATGVTKAVIELGPGGSGCPQAGASVPAAEANFQELEEDEAAPLGTGVTFSSHVTQADALAVQWNFGDGTEEAVSADEYTTTTSKPHEFAKEGEYTVTETIHSNDLAAPTQTVFNEGAFATPTLTVTRRLLVSGPPTAVTEAASAITQTSATLNATVNPNNAMVSECEFEYGTTTGYGSSVPCSSLPGSGSSPVAVSAALGSLSPSTTYHFRIVAENSDGARDGSDRTFTTPSFAPTVLTGAASSIAQTSATLNATVNPNGGTVSECKLEYGTSTSYGSTAACSPTPGSGSSPVAVTASITSLTANTTYHFRITATTGGTSKGADETFTTLPDPPSSEHKEEPKLEPKTEAKAEVLPIVEKKEPTPDVAVASNSTTVSAQGAFVLKLTCPDEDASCSGTVTVRTLTAVVASSGHEAKSKKPKATILTLATVSFTLSAGQVKMLTLHLSANGRALLAKAHVLRTAVTIGAHDPTGGTHTTAVTVTLKPAKATHGRKG